MPDGYINCPFCTLRVGYSEEDPDSAFSDTLGHIRTRHPEQDQTPAELWPKIQTTEAAR